MRLEVKNDRTLKLNNVIIRRVNEEELEDFNFQVEIEKMRNFIRVHGATQIGPLIQHSKIRKDFNEDVKIYLEFIMQCDRNICNVKNQYIHKPVLKISNCMYCHYEGSENNLRFAREKIEILAFEEERKLMGDCYTVYINIENNQIDINNRKSVIESETDIRNYIYNRIIMFLNRDKSIKCDDNIKKYLWITLSASWTILLFGGKFIIDIINIFTDEYKFGINFVMVYVILNLIFLFFNFARLKVIKSNFVYEIVCDVSFVIGINIFVFAQRDTARFQVLILSAYLCCLYLLNIRDLLRKI